MKKRDRHKYQGMDLKKERKRVSVCERQREGEKEWEIYIIAVVGRYRKTERGREKWIIASKKDPYDWFAKKRVLCIVSFEDYNHHNQTKLLIFF